jgi:iron(III) transport system ATP-binding protein
MTDPYLRIQHATKKFDRTVALDDVSFSVDEGSLACLLGPSGCGKTTVLRVIAGLERLDSGRIVLGGRDVTLLPPSQRRFGMVFQSYALFPHLTVGENVAYGLRGKRVRPEDRKRRVQELLELVGLEGTERRFPSQLSGGQQQRVALARALMLSPDILLLDEPLSALDAQVRVRLRAEIRALQQRLGITTLLVTHDQEEALTLADTIIVMNDGKVEQVGSAREVYERPASVFVADFVGSVNVFDADSLRDLGMSSGQDLDYLAGADIVAVRPEHIEVRSRSSADVTDPIGGHKDRERLDPGRGLMIPARVRHVEFCGAYFKLTAQTHWNGPRSQYTVIANSPTSRSDIGELKIGSEVWLHLPAERLLRY